MDPGEATVATLISEISRHGVDTCPYAGIATRLLLPALVVGVRSASHRQLPPIKLTADTSWQPGE